MVSESIKYLNDKNTDMCFLDMHLLFFDHFYAAADWAFKICFIIYVYITVLCLIFMYLSQNTGKIFPLKYINW